MKKRRIIYSIASMLILGVFVFLANKFYFERIRFYKPVAITVKGVSADDFYSIKCWSTGPVRKEIALSPDTLNQMFTGKYAFRQDVVLEIPEHLMSCVTDIRFVSGQVLLNIDQRQMRQKAIQCHNNQSLPVYRISISDFISPYNSSVLMLLSVFHWGAIYWASGLTVLIVSLLAFIYAVFYKRRYSMIEKAIHWIGSFISFIFNEMRIKQKFVWMTFVLLFIIFSLVYFSKSSFTNGVIFRWSEFLYQSSGVNLAHGQGISRIGAMEPLKEYKFNEYGDNIEFNYKLFTRFPGVFFFHNPPGYGLFIGAVYSVFGVNPFWLKCLQLLMLIFVASLLPYAGYKLWKNMGFIAGLPASFIFISLNYSMANNLHPQVLLLFLCFLLVLFFIQYSRTQSALYLLLSGMASAFAALVVIAFLPLPFLILTHLIVVSIKQKALKKLIHSLFFGLAFLVPIFAWSSYASIHDNSIILKGYDFDKLKYELLESPLSAADSAFLRPLITKNPRINDMRSIIRDGGYLQRMDMHNKIAFELFGHSFFRKGFVFIATQTEDKALFMAHNEFLTKGDFNGDWFVNNSSYYSNDKLSGKPAWMRILNFYYHNPDMILKLPVQKLYYGFVPYRFLSLLIMAFILNHIFRIITRNKQLIRRQKILLFFLMNFLFLLSLIIVLPHSLYVIIVFICLLLLIIDPFLGKKLSFLPIPVVFSLIIFNFILLTVLISNNRLYTDVIDFIFILCGLCAGIWMNLKWIFPGNSLTSTIRTAANDIH